MSLLLAGGAAPETITVDKWYKQHETPVRKVFLAAAIAASFFFVENPTAEAETITLDKWAPQVNQPYFKKSRDKFSGEVRFEVPRTILLTDWFTPITQPHFAKKRNSNFGEYRFEVPRTILLTDWFTPITQPHFAKKRNSDFGEYRFEFPIVPFDWAVASQHPWILRQSKSEARYLDNSFAPVPFAQDFYNLTHKGGGIYLGETVYKIRLG